MGPDKKMLGATVKCAQVPATGQEGSDPEGKKMLHARWWTRQILVFIRAPEEGFVKTRLAAAIGAAAACQLYRAFVLDLLETLTAIPREATGDLLLCHDPPDAGERLAAWLGRGYANAPQRGADLGTRMKNAVHASFSEGYDRVLLLGSDIPDLPASIVREAFAALEREDAVIGPCPDGGYYLIGFRSGRFLPEVFGGMAWGTGAVLERTLACLNAHRRRVRVLPPWRDIDTIEDLDALRERHPDDAFRHSRTLRLLASLR
jgi:hypothetical protein